MARSKGDIVRENHRVLKAYKESYLESHPEASKAKSPNINGDVHGFGVTAATLLDSTVKRNFISDMGMESLLYFVGKSLDRQFAYYVLSRTKHTDMSITDNYGRKVFVTAEKINWVLGIPISKKEVKRPKICLKKLQKSRHLYKKFETTRGTKEETAGVFKETLKNAVLNSGDENEYKEAYLLYAICTVLCPSTYDMVQSKYLPLISLAHDAKSYDWCELVFADLKANVGKFEKAFDEDGVIKGLGGAVYVLIIIYLDHLDQQPLNWDVFPRINAWTEGDIRDVKKADKHPKGDFGKIGFVADVWYGRAHPKQTFDILPGEEHAASNFELHQAVAKPARRKRDGPCPNFYLEQAKRRRKRQDVSASSPSASSESSSLSYSRQSEVHYHPHHEYDSFYDQPEVTSTSISKSQEGFPGDSIIPPTSNPQVGFFKDSIIPPTSNHPEVQPSASSKPPITKFFKRQRWKNLHPNANPLPPQNSVPVEIGSRIRRVAKQPKGPHRYVSGDGLMYWRARDWVKGKKVCSFALNCLDRELTFIDCGDHHATLIDSGVLVKNGEVSVNYVRVASVLYTKVWEKRFMKRNRFMLDPAVAMSVLEEKDPELEKYIHLINVTSVNDINTVFFPVMENEHWWCAAFSNNRKEVLVIDSMRGKDAHIVHADSLTKLCSTMNRICKLIDKNCNVDTSDWDRMGLEMPKQRDGVSCGVHMLAAIKLIAFQFVGSIIVGDIQEARKTLFAEDVLCEFNYAREKMIQMALEMAN